MATRITSDFTLEELYRSATADANNIDNKPPQEAIKALSELAINVLQPARTKFQKKIVVLSGYRCPKLNDMVGGADTSQHMKGQAADIDAGSFAENQRLFAILRAGEFDQLINEHNLEWIHVSYNPGKNRKQILAL